MFNVEDVTSVISDSSSFFINNTRCIVHAHLRIGYCQMQLGNISNNKGSKKLRPNFAFYI